MRCNAHSQYIVVRNCQFLLFRCSHNDTELQHLYIRKLLRLKSRNRPLKWQLINIGFLLSLSLLLDVLNIWDYISFIVTCVCFYIYFRGLASGWIWQCKLCNHEIIQFPKEPINIYELNYMCTIKIRMHPNIIIPETFKGINALCPTKSSQNCWW